MHIIYESLENGFIPISPLYKKGDQYTRTTPLSIFQEKQTFFIHPISFITGRGKEMARHSKNIHPDQPK